MANKKENLNTVKTKAGFLIILVAVITLGIAIFSGGIWFLNIEQSKIFVGNTINAGNSLNAQIQNVDVDKIFEDKYFIALEKLSNTIAYGTTWLELCENSQTIIEEEVYMKVCSAGYSSLDDIKTSYGEYISTDLIEMYMSEYYKEYNNSLYVIPISINKDDSYVGIESYSLKSKTPTKLEYIVTSKYSDIGCEDSCKYSYKNQKFILENQNNKWIVVEMELPY